MEFTTHLMEHQATLKTWQKYMTIYYYNNMGIIGMHAHANFMGATFAWGCIGVVLMFAGSMASILMWDGVVPWLCVGSNSLSLDYARGRRGDALKFCGVTLCVVTLSIYILYQEWTPRCQPNGCFAFGTGDVWPVHCWDTNSLITSPVHCHWSFRLAFAGGLSSERLVWIRVRIMLQIISFFIGNTW